MFLVNGYSYLNNKGLNDITLILNEIHAQIAETVPNESKSNVFNEVAGDFLNMLRTSNSAVNNDTTLHVAIRSGNYRINESAKVFFADLNKPNTHNEMPLDVAYQNIKDSYEQLAIVNKKIKISKCEKSLHSLQQIKTALKQDLQQQKDVFANLVHHGAKPEKTVTKKYLQNNQHFWQSTYKTNHYLENLKYSFENVAEQVEKIRADYRLSPELQKRYAAEMIEKSLKRLQATDIIKLHKAITYIPEKSSTQDPRFQILCIQPQSHYYMRKIQGLYANTTELGALNKAISKYYITLNPVYTTLRSFSIWSRIAASAVKHAVVSGHEIMPESEFVNTGYDAAITALKFIEESYQTVQHYTTDYAYACIEQLQNLLIYTIENYFSFDALNYFRENEPLNQLVDHENPAASPAASPAAAPAASAAIDTNSTARSDGDKKPETPRSRCEAAIDYASSLLGFSSGPCAA